MRRRRERKASSDPAGVPAAQSAPEQPLGDESWASWQQPPTAAGTPTAAYWTPGRPVAGHSTSMPSAEGGALGGQTGPGWPSSPADRPSPLSQSGSGSGYDVWTPAQSPHDAGSQQTRPVWRDALAGQQPDSRQSESVRGYFGTSSVPHEESSSSAPYQPGRPSGSQPEYGGQSYSGRQAYGGQHTSGTEHTSFAGYTSDAQPTPGAQQGDGAASGDGDQGSVGYQAYRGGQGEAGQNPTGYGQPSHGQPSHGQPSHGQPSHGQPSHGQPSHGQPCEPWPADGQRPALLRCRLNVRGWLGLRPAALPGYDFRPARLFRPAGLLGSGE